jgi:hypothetical protein
MKKLYAAIVPVALALEVVACVSVKTPSLTPTPPVPGASLWVKQNIAQQDLFNGPWGAANAPDPRGVFTLVERKHSGVNPGMTVRDERGREWSVKQPFPGGFDSEAHSEVAVSRLLSGLGYHQPPVYYLPSFTLKDEFGTHSQVGGRFRLKLKELDEKGEWSWAANPFIGSRPHQGLLVLAMMFNSTDMKDSNNSVYEHRNGDLAEQWYVMRDVGASLGDADRFSPRKGHIDAFERTRFVLGIDGGKVQFAYNGWYSKLVDNRITAADLQWTMDLLGQLTARQWQDAFRAAGFERAVADRYIRKMRQKMEEAKGSQSRASARD